MQKLKLWVFCAILCCFLQVDHIYVMKIAFECLLLSVKFPQLKFVFSSLDCRGKVLVTNSPFCLAFLCSTFTQASWGFSSGTTIFGDEWRIFPFQEETVCKCLSVHEILAPFKSMLKIPLPLLGPEFYSSPIAK